MMWPGRLSAGVNRAVEPLVAMLAVFFTGLLVVSVFSRYVFDISIVEGVELTRIAFVWSVFLAASSATARRGHIRITFAVEFLPAALCAATQRLCDLAILGFGATIVWFGSIFTERVTDTFFPTLQVSQAWMYAALPVSGALIVLHAFAHLTEPVVDVKPLRERLP